MKLKNKLLTIITPTVVLGTVAPMVGCLSSCGSTQEKKEEQKIPTKIIKMDKVQKMDDINAETAPLCILNTDAYHLCELVCHVPENTTVKAFYQVGDYNPTTNTISWEGKEWVQMSNGGEKQNLEYMHPIRFYAYNTDNTKLGSFNTHLNKDDKTDLEFRILFTKMDGSKFERGKGVKLAGSVRSLLGTKEIEGDTVTTVDDLNENSKYAFSGLFAGYLGDDVDASGDICEINPKFLPFNTMVEGCYSHMFANNTNLLVAPDLPASTLDKQCYYRMFAKCTGLESAPYLPAKKVTNGCYQEMFSQCTGLNSVSLGYVGNFYKPAEESETNIAPFNNWLEKAGTTDAKLYYNGEDTEQSDSAIPTSFTVVSKKTTDPEWLNAHTKVVEVKNDKDISTNQTSKLTSTKTKFRAYNDELASNLTEQFPSSESLVSGVNTYSYYKKVGTNSPQIVDLQKEGLKASELPDTLYVKYEKPREDDPKVSNVISHGNIKVTLRYKASGSTLQYWDKKTKQYVNFNQGGYVELTDGDVLKLRGDINSTSTTQYTNLVITGSGTCDLTGTVMSFLSNTDEPATSLLGREYCFYSLFADSTAIASIDENYLPASSVALTKGCFQRMFMNCTKIQKAPALPSTDLKEMCYAEMFSGCTALDKVSGDLSTYLPATTSAGGCYYKMFYKTGLTTAPTINFAANDTNQMKTTSKGVCERMFLQCTSLKNANFVLKPNIINPGAYSHMFAGCTALENAPQIDAYRMESGYASGGDVGDGCCGYMYEGCTKLAKASVFGYDGTEKWFAGNYSMAGMYYMGGTSSTGSKLKTAPDLSKFTYPSSKTNIYKDMFKGCNSLRMVTSSGTGRHLVLPSGSWSKTSAESMFYYTKNSTGSSYNSSNSWGYPQSSTSYYYVEY